MRDNYRAPAGVEGHPNRAAAALMEDEDDHLPAALGPHLRDVLGDQTYESLAHKGETMTTAEMATYAYVQIDQARTELEHPS